MNISSFGEDELGELYVIDLNGSVKRIASTAQPTLDVDASGAQTKYDGLTDGLLAIRRLFGLDGSALTSAALGATATRTDPADVARYLDASRAALDIDGDGRADALSDGMLIVRYLLGLRGGALTNSAITPGAPRNTAALIEGYLRMLMP
jgi:hypothetical protein